MCVKCFWLGSESPYDYIVTMLASKGLVITFQDKPVLVLKQFSADFLADKEAVTRPDESWVWVSGDDFWQNYSGQTDQLRDYITNYSVTRESDCVAKED